MPAFPHILEPRDSRYPTDPFMDSPTPETPVNPTPLDQVSLTMKSALPSSASPEVCREIYQTILKLASMLELTESEKAKVLDLPPVVRSAQPSRFDESTRAILICEQGCKPEVYSILAARFIREQLRSRNEDMAADPAYKAACDAAKKLSFLKRIFKGPYEAAEAKKSSASETFRYQRNCTDIFLVSLATELLSQSEIGGAQQGAFLEKWITETLARERRLGDRDHEQRTSYSPEILEKLETITSMAAFDLAICQDTCDKHDMSGANNRLALMFTDHLTSLPEQPVWLSEYLSLLNESAEILNNPGATPDERREGLFRAEQKVKELQKFQAEIVEKAQAWPAHARTLEQSYIRRAAGLFSAHAHQELLDPGNRLRFTEAFRALTAEIYDQYIAGAPVDTAKLALEEEYRIGRKSAEEAGRKRQPNGTDGGTAH